MGMMVGRLQSQGFYHYKERSVLNTSHVTVSVWYDGGEVTKLGVLPLQGEVSTGQ
jgi:hypothetical protein